MISGIGPDISSRMLDRNRNSDADKRSSEKSDLFADQIKTSKNAAPDQAKKAAPEKPLEKTPEKARTMAHEYRKKTVKASAERKEQLSGPTQDGRVGLNDHEMAPIRSQRIDEHINQPDIDDSSDDSEIEEIQPKAKEKSAKGMTISGLSPDAKTDGLPDFFSPAALRGETTGLVKPGHKATNVEVDPETIQMLEATRQEQAQVKQSAMIDFVQSMKTEVGVAPDKILEAFSTMEPSSLAAPPEDSMKEFIGKLNLAPAAQAKATDLYKTMLAKTNEADLTEKLGGLEDGANFEVLSQRDDSIRKLSESLDDLNKSFFHSDVQTDPKKAQQAIESMDAEIARLAQNKKMAGADDVDASDDDSGDDQKTNALLGSNALMGAKMMKGAEVANETATASQAGAATATPLNTLNMPAMSHHANSSLLGGGAEDSAGSEAGRDGSQKAIADKSFATQMKAANPTAANEMKEATKKSAGESTSSASMPTSSDSLSSNTATSTVSQTGAQAPTGPSAAAGAAAGPSAMMMNRQATPQEEQENIREMIKQAQVVLKRGGGEMKLEMKPEGMGQVRMRVSVENGQVNVQMLTDNEASKHLLEKGLHELKSSLAAEQLKLDTMKVDVGSDIKKQMDNNANDGARQQSRQMAQDFLGQFREDRQQAREDAVSGLGWKQYGANRGGRASIQPEVAAASRARAAGNAKRLDLVA